jgi:4a-hydroxytetrahydrobiopterin dehydratase
MKIDPKEAARRLAKIPGWSIEGSELVQEFRFRDFSEAFGFMTSVAVIAEKLDHHPDWSNSYNRVTIRLSTHSAGGVTDLDFDMATRIGGLAEIMFNRP